MNEFKLRGKMIELNEKAKVDTKINSNVMEKDESRSKYMVYSVVHRYLISN